MVNMVDAELKTEVREDMRAAIITASIRPRDKVTKALMTCLRDEVTKIVVMISSCHFLKGLKVANTNLVPKILVITFITDRTWTCLLKL